MQCWVDGKSILASIVIIASSSKVLFTYYIVIIVSSSMVLSTYYNILSDHDGKNVINEKHILHQKHIIS